MEKQQHAISQKHQSPRERDDRFRTYAAEMGPEGLQDSSAWTQSDSETYFEEARRRKAENATKIINWMALKYSART
jgi:hypothetical protein